MGGHGLLGRARFMPSALLAPLAHPLLDKENSIDEQSEDETHSSPPLVSEKITQAVQGESAKGGQTPIFSIVSPGLEHDRGFATQNLPPTDTSPFGRRDSPGQRLQNEGCWRYGLDMRLIVESAPPFRIQSATPDWL